MIKSPFYFSVSSVSLQFLICVIGTRKEEQLSSNFVCFDFQNKRKKIKYPEPFMRKKGMRKMIAVYINTCLYTYTHKCTDSLQLKTITCHFCFIPPSGTELESFYQIILRSALCRDTCSGALGGLSRPLSKGCCPPSQDGMGRQGRVETEAWRTKGHIQEGKSLQCKPAMHLWDQVLALQTSAYPGKLLITESWSKSPPGMFFCLDY